MATYHGITKAICLNCGKVTTDETQLEILNDLDPTCTDCSFHSVAWHSANGIVVTSQATNADDVDTNRFEAMRNECLVCHTTTNLLTEETREQYRKDGWLGVDFYPAICDDCFQLEKEIR
jgi:hypothetical protein